MPINEVQEMADKFMADYNGNIPLKITVIENEEGYFGEPVEETFKGAYYAKSGEVLLVAANLENNADTSATIRHEILAHYGLDTFSKQDKRDILDQIIKSKKHPS